jgi:hypothetical protein
MLTDDDLPVKLAEAFGEQAGRRAPVVIDAAGIFRRGRRRRARRIVTQAVSVAAAAGLVAGVLIAHSGPAPTARVAQPGTGQLPASKTGPLPGNTLLDAAIAPALSAEAAEAGMPKYYVVPGAQSSGALQVRSSTTGKVISTVTPSAACDPKTFKVAAAGNDRDFVVGCVTTQKIMFYRLRITSRGLTAAFTPLTIATPGDFLNDIALTADGSKLAIGLQGFDGAAGALEVVTLATGVVRTWTTPQGGSPFDLSWADQGRQLGFSWDSRGAGLRVLDVTVPGHDLMSARQVLPGVVGSDQVQSAMLSPDGATIIASVTYNDLSAQLGRDTVVGGIVEISARTGGPLRTLLAEHAQYSRDGGGHEAGWYVTQCQLGAMDTTGHHLLIGCDQFGRLDGARFTALPGVALQSLYTAAW